MGKPIQKDLGADLRKIRQNRGFSLKEVAGRMGISMPYLSDLERGNRRWSDELKQIFENAIKPMKKETRMTCPYHASYNLNKIKDSLPPLPKNMKDLPIDERGYPVPWFVPWIDGKPEFLMADGKKLYIALTQRRCWVCGKALPALGKPVTFVIGPMCMINRITSEPPNHMECAEFSVKGCPFLSRPNMARRENDNTDKYGKYSNVAGIMIERNPGVSLLYTTRSFKLVPDEKGKKLISLGEPTVCSFWREGRPALPAEVKESVDTGLPLLRQMCFSVDDHKALDEAIAKNQRHFPWT